ncbi:TolC family protein [Maricurvus nonylphenolicus]|uniref:TolC family protein n=1 Tax=Maricurvus nonylphenolicus TaxID=1008307 RepID=UPI0036F3A6CD
MKPIFRAATLGWLLLCLPYGTSALANAEATISLQQALQQTLQYNPALQAYPYLIRGAEAERLQASLRPTPTLSLEAENLAGSGDYSGSDEASYTLSLSQVIELGQKRQKRVALASAKERQLQNEYELTRLDTLAETSRRYYQVLRLQALQTSLTERIEREKNALSVIEHRVKAGAVGKADAAKMALRLAQSQARQQQLQLQWQQAKSNLTAMWLAEADFANATGNLLHAPNAPEQEHLLSALQASPAYMQQTALQRLADARLQLAQANGKTDVSVGLGIRQLESSNDQALVFSAAMPLAFSNPNRGRIAAAQAQRQWSQQRSELLQRQLQLSLNQIRQQLQSSLLQIDTLQSQLLPKAQQLLSATQKGYQQGRYSVLQWADAQAELFALKRQNIELHTQAFLQLLELERLTGQALNTKA